MKNYEYIIAGLPVVDSGFRFTDTTPDEFIAQIREQLDSADNALVDFLMKGYAEDCLTPEFYAEALAHRNRFLREYFRFDLCLRALDDLVWENVSKMTVFDYFDIEAVLAFIVKMQVVARWYRLDEQSGREMFRKLVGEVRGTFKGVNYTGA